MARKPLLRKRKYQSGQGLIEYAIILVVVAVISIVIVFLVGQGVQRLYGLVLGSLGGKHNETGVIEITAPNCYADEKQQKTGFSATGYASASATPLFASTNNMAGTGLNGGFTQVTVDSSGTWTFNPLLSNTVADITLCPQVLVLQGPHGEIAVAPVVSIVIPRGP